MEKGIKYAGLDVHKKDIRVAMVGAHGSEPVEWTVTNDLRAVRRLARKLNRDTGGSVQCAYEAGPCGYALKRQLGSEGIVCQVVAPSLIPVKPGERIKTDRRDARKLAEMLRAGLLTEVRCPTPQEEAVRDLCRCREDAKQDQLRARHRLGKYLLRRGLVFTAGRNWTQRHRVWLRSLRFEQEAERVVFEDYLLAVELVEERLRGLEQKLEEISRGEIWAERVGWLRCFRGIDTLTAITILAELHDFRRFRSPRQLMAYLGLVPSEHSSGEAVRRGGITKAGNAHARRVLGEAAWHYRHRPAVGVSLRKRRKGQPAEIIALADRAQRRLHRRYWRLVMKGKPTPKAITAVARELAGFLWAALYLYPQLRDAGQLS
ncbi:MAG: IS110 family transposase [Gemmatimonadetes bacterium]|nr:IS110 family transposase [Gemmatimonadota bacterium]